MSKKILPNHLFFFLLLLLTVFKAQAVNITGAGASLPFPIYAKWSAQYYEKTGKKMAYSVKTGMRLE